MNQQVFVCSREFLEHHMQNLSTLASKDALNNSWNARPYSVSSYHKYLKRYSRINAEGKLNKGNACYKKHRTIAKNKEE